MFRDAAKEVRYHPGRVVATLIAIAISVGFMAAVSIFVDTQSDALGKMMSLTTSKADVVAAVNNPKPKVTSQQLEAAIKGAAGVQQAEPSRPGQTALSTDKANVYASIYPTPSQDFRWAPLTNGKYPEQPTEITLAKQLADQLGVGVGQSVEAGGQPLTVVGITDDAPSIFFQTAYVAPSLANEKDSWPGGTWLVKTSDPQATSKAIHDALAPLTEQPDEELYPGAGGKNLEVSTAHEAQQQAVKAISGEFDVLKYILWVFSAIAALVGIIIIANTFTILLTQRRRQIGLLRAVGATGGQVRRKFLAEAVLLGLLGSLLGLVFGATVAWGGASVTGASYFGLKFPWLDLGVQVLIGILLTVLAAVLPSLRATRVAPLEALQPVATSEQRRRGTILRAIVCGLLVAGGIALAVLSVNATVADDTPVWQGPVVLAMGGAGLISLGVLFGAQLFIPTVLKGLGKLFSWAGPTPALAAANAVRNPGRASATATALMLACGLIVTLQVGTATAQRTALDEIHQKYPVDVQVTAARYSSREEPASGLKDPVVAALTKLPNVKSSVTLSGGPVVSSGAVSVGTVLGSNGAVRTVTDQVPASIADGEILVNKKVKRGTPVTLQAVDAKDQPTGQKVTLTAVPSSAIAQTQGMVSAATLAKLVTKPTAQAYWAQLADQENMGSTMTQLQRLTSQHPDLQASGSATEAFMITKILDILLKVITGLLGAAVVIALIGVSNTLGLSVIERTRESALLRALGMQKTSLRLMLLVEALLLALAGVLVGVLAGGFFGWLGIRAVLRQAGMGSQIQFAVNWPLTLGLIGVAVLAAALASILPGRKAASATPTEALAEE